jgi:hypothetical protein
VTAGAGTDRACLNRFFEARQAAPLTVDQKKTNQFRRFIGLQPGSPIKRRDAADYGDFGAPAAFFAFRLASLFARLAVPAKSFFARFFLRRVSSILE